MIIYKNVDYGIYAYQIGFFKVKRIGEIVWSDQYDSKNEKFYLRIEGFYVAEERRRHGLGRKLLNKTIKQNLNENYPYMIVYPKTFGEKILKDNSSHTVSCILILNKIQNESLSMLNILRETLLSGFRSL